MGGYGGDMECRFGGEPGRSPSERRSVPVCCCASRICSGAKRPRAHGHPWLRSHAGLVLPAVEGRQRAPDVMAHAISVAALQKFLVAPQVVVHADSRAQELLKRDDADGMHHDIRSALAAVDRYRSSSTSTLGPVTTNPL